jgi:small redox-active disulfide protein 2
MKIEIFGPGCRKCEKTYEEVKKALEQLGLDADIEHVTDMDAIVDRGVMLTPAVFIDGEKKSEGKVPRVSDIEDWLRP